ncbi:MAG TPA: MFS transporter, partial [Puia sp.]|nr:MFS transporter [Puia sp.]
YSDKTLKRKSFIWPFLLLAAIAFYSSYLVGSHNFWLSFTLLCLAGMSMYVPYGPFFAMIIEILPSNVAGGALAMINSFGALGSFGGAYLVGYLNGSTGGFGASYFFMAVAVFLSVVLTFIAVKETDSR